MKPLFDHFGVLAPFYEFFIHPKDPGKLWSLACLPSEGILLDAGGGTGRVAQHFRDKVGQIVVTDKSLKMLHEARIKGGLQTVQSYTESSPFMDGSFDCIIMVDALHHVANQSKTADELWRILKPGGRLIIEEPDIRSFGVKMIALAEKLAFMRTHFLAPHDIANLFQHRTSKIRIRFKIPLPGSLLKNEHQGAYNSELLSSSNLLLTLSIWVCNHLLRCSRMVFSSS